MRGACTLSRWDTAEHIQTSTARVSELLQLIVATREYQFA
jgi:hypothetical protein